MTGDPNNVNGARRAHLLVMCISENPPSQMPVSHPPVDNTTTAQTCRKLSNLERKSFTMKSTRHTARPNSLERHPKACNAHHHRLPPRAFDPLPKAKVDLLEVRRRDRSTSRRARGSRCISESSLDQLSLHRRVHRQRQEDEHGSGREYE